MFVLQDRVPSAKGTYTHDLYQNVRITLPKCQNNLPSFHNQPTLHVLYEVKRMLTTSHLLTPRILNSTFVFFKDSSLKQLVILTLFLRSQFYFGLFSTYPQLCMLNVHFRSLCCCNLSYLFQSPNSLQLDIVVLQVHLFQ